MTQGGYSLSVNTTLVTILLDERFELLRSTRAVGVRDGLGAWAALTFNPMKDGSEDLTWRD